MAWGSEGGGKKIIIRSLDTEAYLDKKTVKLPKPNYYYKCNLNHPTFPLLKEEL